MQKNVEVSMHNLNKNFTLLFFSFFTILLVAQDNEQDANDGVTELEEIVVTATSRESSLLEVPDNISTISGAELEERAVQDTSELLRSFAGISTIDRGYRNAGTTNSARIRGFFFSRFSK